MRYDHRVGALYRDPVADIADHYRSSRCGGARPSVANDSPFGVLNLPLTIELLKCVKYPLECIVIDGYVTLGAGEHPGLGMLLWQHLDGKIPVIGIAKSKFVGTPENAEILRGGGSLKPLFVTAAGVDLQGAKNNVIKMGGKFRIPDLIKAADRLSRNPGDV